MDGLETGYAIVSGTTGSDPEDELLILPGLGCPVTWPGNGPTAGWEGGLYHAAPYSLLPLPLTASNAGVISVLWNTILSNADSV